MAGYREKDEPFGQGGSFKPDQNVDLEGRRRTSTNVAGRKMSRIGPPPRNNSVVANVLADDVSSQDDFTKLVEMEAEDAIKYRTCSWQKVNLPSAS